MPDLINPEYVGPGDPRHILWKDELCVSCNVSGNCPLLQVLHSHEILTASGCHVVSCKLYDPDTTSPYYVPPDADMGTIHRINVDTLQQSAELLNTILGKALDHVNV